MNLLFAHKSYLRVNGPVAADLSPSFAQGMTGLWTFSEPKAATTIHNGAMKGSNLTLQAGASLGVDIGGRALKGVAATTSYAVTSGAASLLGIAGPARRTIFCRFKANLSSSGGNLGGLFAYGDSSTTASLFAVHQVSDSPSNNGPDQWCVDLGTSKLYFIVPNTAGKIHDIVVTFDSNSLQVYVDGNAIGQLAAALATSSSPTFSVGRWFNSASDVSINYFSGSIFQIGTVNYDWTAIQVREWHVRPNRILRPRGSLNPPAPFGTVPVITLTGLPPNSGIGNQTIAGGLSTINLNGLAPSSGIGTPLVGLGSDFQFVFAQGIAPNSGIGTPSFTRQGGVFVSQPVATTTWTPVPAAPGG